MLPRLNLRLIQITCTALEPCVITGPTSAFPAKSAQSSSTSRAARRLRTMSAILTDAASAESGPPAGTEPTRDIIIRTRGASGFDVVAAIESGRDILILSVSPRSSGVLYQ